MGVAVITIEATTQVLPLLVVTTVGDTGTLDATNPTINVVDVVIIDNDFKVSSLSKKGIADNVITANLAVDSASLIIDTSIFAKDPDKDNLIRIFVKIFGIIIGSIKHVSCFFTQRDCSFDGR